MEYGTIPSEDDEPRAKRRTSLPSVARTASVRRRLIQQYRNSHHQHSYVYTVLNSSKIKWFNRILGLVIIANVIADVLITVPSVQAAYQSRFDLFETGSSLFFIAEYISRFIVAGERPKYAGLVGRVRFATSTPSLIDVISFAPWLIEKFIWLSGIGYHLPATGFMRVFRMLRILKTERFVGSVDAITRVVYMNSSILLVAAMMALMLLLLTSSMLYYANRSTGDPQFESIPACLYAAILMLTGQGEPDGELTEVTKLLCAFTALFSVAMVAIPASMLTFGFEIEATRLAKKRREARLRRKLRIELDDPDIATSSNSESDDATLIRRAERRRRRRLALEKKRDPRKAKRQSLSSYCCRCRSYFKNDTLDKDNNSPEKDGTTTSSLVEITPNAQPLTSTLFSLAPPPLYMEELDSSEAEYEELVLGKTEADAYAEVKDEVIAKQRKKTNIMLTRQRRQSAHPAEHHHDEYDLNPPLDIELSSTHNTTEAP